MKSIWILLQALIGYNLVVPIALYVIYSAKRKSFSNFQNEDSLPNKKKLDQFKRSQNYYDYAIIVTAYEETALLFPLVESILKMDYNNYLIYIVADNCDVSTLKFDNERIILLRPETVLASNTKSHFYAISHFKRKHEILTIIDSDNLVHPQYLKELNKYFDLGFNAVQGTRTAKKTNSTIARIDSVRDIYYHFYDGKLLFDLGSSATLSGSGMAFKTNLFIDCLDKKEISGAGFDKVLQAQIVMKDERIAFASQAVVYDEKTSHSQQLVNQRSRWINTWFKYFSFGFELIKMGIINKSLNQFLFGLILLRPPLFIFISLSFSCLLIELGLKSEFVYLWLLGFAAFSISFYISLKQSKGTNINYNFLLGIPKFIFFQFLSLFLVKSVNKRSVATKHQIDL